MSKLFETVFGMVRGGVHPREVAIAIVLGTLAGFVMGWNFTLLAVLLLVLVLKAPLNVFGQTWGIAAVLSLAMTPVTYRTGRSLLENSTFGRWLSGHADTVWLALFDWDRYTLVGGAVWALVIGLPAAFVIARLTRWLQHRLHELQEKFDGEQQKWKLGFTVRVACWMIFGGYEKAETPSARPRFFRKLGLVAVALVLAPAGFAAWMYGPSFAENSFLYTLTAANRAEVTADDMQLSLSDGLLNIYNLQISDPDNLDQDRFRIKQVTAVVRPGPLLRGQVLIDKILLTGITSDTPRAQRAKPFSIHIPGFDEKPEPAQASAPAQADDESVLGMNLKDYVPNWQTVRERLRQAERTLKIIELVSKGKDPLKKAVAKKQKEQQPEVPLEFLALRSEHCDFGQPRPQVHVKVMRAKDLTPKWGLGERAMVELTNLTSNPQLIGKPTRLEVVAPDLESKVVAELNYHRPGARHTIEFEARNVDLARLINQGRAGQRLAVRGGSLHISGQGSLSSKEFELPVRIDARQLDLTLAKTDRFAGLSPELWNQGLRELGGAFQIEAGVFGPWRSPRLQLNTDEILAHFRQQLLAAGKTMVVQAVDEQLEKGKRLAQNQINTQVDRGQAVVADARGQAEIQLNAASQQAARITQGAETKIDQAEQAVNQSQQRVDQKIAGATSATQGQLSDAQGQAHALLDAKTKAAQQATDALGLGPVEKIPGGAFAGNLIDEAAGRAQRQVQGVRNGAARSSRQTGDVARDPLTQGRGQVDLGQRYSQSYEDTARNALDSRQENANSRLEGGRNQATRYTEQGADRVRGLVERGFDSLATDAVGADGASAEESAAAGRYDQHEPRYTNNASADLARSSQQDGYDAQRGFPHYRETPDVAPHISTESAPANRDQPVSNRYYQTQTQASEPMVSNEGEEASAIASSPYGQQGRYNESAAPERYPTTEESSQRQYPLGDRGPRHSPREIGQPQFDRPRYRGGAAAKSDGAAPPAHEKGFYPPERPAEQALEAGGSYTEAPYTATQKTVNASLQGVKDTATNAGAATTAESKTTIPLTKPPVYTIPQPSANAQSGQAQSSGPAKSGWRLWPFGGTASQPKENAAAEARQAPQAEMATQPSGAQSEQAKPWYRRFW